MTSKTTKSTISKKGAPKSSLYQKPLKASAGKVVKKPEILEGKSSKIALVMQSRVMVSAKKGKGDYSNLPPGVVASIKNKERIAKALNIDGTNTVDAIKQKYEIDGKPLTRKRAQGIIEERKDFFEKNRKKSIKAANELSPKAEKKTSVKKVK
ncbi:hypothetical protein SGLAD_v1c04790 [Spiroplasma gladiatoris]|uniref:Uncharacterized protein n=1 Tax=Spiroplasma gladiatoris TaxID=2143 RepID=A0A4P7AIT7_9MOLU|nr:hypothetical protein [Spiroplasma gladiatoris]QBQ07678.1 hypothetical protein SGLAD_v1c04790 [Spiroplasma gladiatoris]